MKIDRTSNRKNQIAALLKSALLALAGLLTASEATAATFTATPATGQTWRIPASGDKGDTDPFPLTLTVPGTITGTITDVNVTLHNLSHAAIDDLDIFLAAPGTSTSTPVVALMSDISTSTTTPVALNQITFTFDDSGTAFPSPGDVDSALVDGTRYQPESRGGITTELGLLPSYLSLSNSLAGFNGRAATGEWKLYISDDSDSLSGGTGSLASWSLTFGVLPDAQLNIPESLTVNEGASKHYRLVLDGELPSNASTTTVALTVADPDLLTLDKSRVTFTASDWDPFLGGIRPQTVTVTAKRPDGFDDSTTTIRHAYSIGSNAYTTNLPVRIVDTGSFTCPSNTNAPLHGRSGKVVNGILSALAGVSDGCAVTAEQLASITSLDLSGRDITRLHTSDLAGLTNLRSLNLSDNLLASLPEGVFDNLDKLEEVNLRGNPFVIDISDDDGPLRLEFASVNRIVQEGNGANTIIGLALNVVDGPRQTQVPIVANYETFDYLANVNFGNSSIAKATAGEDYFPTRGKFRYSRDGVPIDAEGNELFAADGETPIRRVISILIKGDRKLEKAERFGLRVTYNGENEEGTTTTNTITAMITIQNDDRHVLPTSPNIPPTSPNIPPTNIDAPPLVFSRTRFSLNEGATKIYRVRRASLSRQNVSILLTSSSTNIFIRPSELTFMPQNWNEFQTVSVTALRDADTADENILIRHTVEDSGESELVRVTVTDTGAYSPTPEPTEPTEPIDPLEPTEPTEPPATGLILTLSATEGANAAGMRLSLGETAQRSTERQWTAPNAASSWSRALQHGSARIAASSHASLENTNKLMLYDNSVNGNPFTGQRNTLWDDAQYVPLETPLSMQADRGPATEFTIIGLFLNDFLRSAVGKDKFALVTSVEDAGVGWPAGTVFTYVQGGSSTLALNGERQSTYASFFHPGTYTLGGQMAGELRIAALPTDYDADGDGLIEIRTLAQLNAVRWDLDGNGEADEAEEEAPYAAAFPNAIESMGCADGCVGYELAVALSFDTNGDGLFNAADAYWDEGAGWAPIGDQSQPFNARFAGNGLALTELYQKRSAGASSLGLFGALGYSGEIVGLKLREVRVSGVHWAGALAGINWGEIEGSAVEGGRVEGHSSIGGLTGHNFGTVRDSGIERLTVEGDRVVGGLVGWNSGTVSGGQSAGTVRGQSLAGGLVGYNFGFIRLSASESAVSGGTDRLGCLAGSNLGTIEGSLCEGEEEDASGDGDSSDTDSTSGEGDSPDTDSTSGDDDSPDTDSTSGEGDSSDTDSTSGEGDSPDTDSSSGDGDSSDADVGS